MQKPWQVGKKLDNKTDLKSLQKIWYDKLKKSGFTDIEHGDTINCGVPRSAKWEDPIVRQSTQDYYGMAYQFLHSHKFDSELEKVIWEYHAEGLSIRDIVKVLNKVLLRRRKTNRIRVWKIISRLVAEMKRLYLSV